MAVTRVTLPRKGFVQPQHGLTQYEADMDGNLALLDSRVVFLEDLFQSAFPFNGVISGFTLSTSGTLVAGLSTGVLFAQGQRYAPSSPPTLPAAPSNQSSYLFYNSTTGFYYQPSAVGATTGDALIGIVGTSTSAVTGVQQATVLFGLVDIPSTSTPGNLTVPHLLGRAPNLTELLITSAGSFWWQTTPYDGTSLNLVSSDSGLTAKVRVA